MKIVRSIKDYFDFLVDRQTSHDLRNRFEESGILTDLMMSLFYAVGAAVLFSVAVSGVLLADIGSYAFFTATSIVLLAVAVFYGSLFVVANLFVLPSKHLAKRLLSDLELQEKSASLMEAHEELEEKLKHAASELEEAKKSTQIWMDDCYMHEDNHDKSLKEIERLKGEVEASTTKEKTAHRETARLKADFEELKRNYESDISKRDSENRRLHRAKEEMLHKSLEGFGFDSIVEFLNFKLSNDFSDPLPEKDVAVLYGLLQEHVPDKERMKEISLVPHEILRARQIERVVEHYSQKITEVENSDLSETEKRNKINAYRLARERELGIEE